MKKLTAVMLVMVMLFLSAAVPVFAQDEKIFLGPGSFDSLGTWTVTNEQGAADNTTLKGVSQEAGAPLPQTESAAVEITLENGGEYTVFVHTRDFAASPGTRRCAVYIDGQLLENEVGKHGTDGWAWEKAGALSLTPGKHTLELKETTSFARVDAVCVASGSYYPPNEPEHISALLKDAEADVPQGQAPTPTPPPMEPTTPEPLSAPQFTDIPESFDWARGEIEHLAAEGYISGREEGIFAPSDTITRAEFITLCVNLLNKPDAAYSGVFEDVSTSDWFAGQMETAYQEGLLAPELYEGGLLHPNQPINRQEMASVIYHTYQALYPYDPPRVPLSFQDEGQIAGYAKDAVASGTALGIIYGMGDNLFAPLDNATRAQAAVMMLRLLESYSGSAYLYVSPSGSDSGDGSFSAPLATLQEAVDRAKENTVIYVRGGTYTISQPLQINKSHITIAAYPGEDVTLSGGYTITGGWEEDEKGIYKTSVPEGTDFRQLYIDGVKAVRARYPNNENLVFEQERTENGFITAPFPLPEKNQDTLELQCYSTWMHKIFHVSEITQQEEEYLLSIRPEEWETLVAAINAKVQGSVNYQGEQYWLENAYEFVDAPWEWYLDTQTSTLYLMPPEGRDPNTLSVTFPVSQGLIEVRGTEQAYIEDIAIDGLRLTYAGWNRPSLYGFCDVQANSILPLLDNQVNDPSFRHSMPKEKITGAVDCCYANGIAVKNCAFQHLGGNGFTLSFGGENTTLAGNLFADISGNGIEIGNDCYKPADLRVVPKNVLVENNYIYNVSNDYHGGIGLLLMYADGAVIQNNTVSHVPYTGINASWGWDSPEVSPTFTKDMIIRQNRVEYYAMRTYDTGGIYMPNPVYGVNRVEYNYIRGGYDAMANRSVQGIYHDGNSQNWTDIYNVIENVYQWVISGSATTQKKNNMAVHNYINTAEEGAIMNGENNYAKDTVVSARYDWGEEAQKIIENAGPAFRYQDLAQSLTGQIAAAQRESLSFVDKNQTADILVDITNFTDKERAISVTSAQGNKMLDSVQQSLTLAPGETKTITVQADQKKAEGLVKDYLVLDMEGKQTKIPVSISSSSVGAGDKIFDTSASCYQETGNWFDSTLMGYDNQKTRYGQDEGAACSWTPEISGTYRVSVFNIPHEVSAKNLKIQVVHKDGMAEKTIDSSQEAAGFLEIGAFTFSGSPEEGVFLTFDGAPNGAIRASAVKFEEA